MTQEEQNPNIDDRERSPAVDDPAFGPYVAFDLRETMASLGISAAEEFTDSTVRFQALDETPRLVDGVEWLPVGAASWDFQGVHDGAGNQFNLFDGVRPTGNTIEISGVSVVLERADDGLRSYMRYFDWPALFAQMGLTVATQPLIDVPQEPPAGND